MNMMDNRKKLFMIAMTTDLAILGTLVAIVVLLLR